MGENKRYKKSEKYKGVYQRKDGSWFYRIKKTFSDGRVEYYQQGNCQSELEAHKERISYLREIAYYAETLKNIIQMVKAFCRSRSRSAYKKAVEEKRVGRPSKTDNVEQAMKLYKSGSYTVSQIETLTGISKSTLYKYLKE